MRHGLWCVLLAMVALASGQDGADREEDGGAACSTHATCGACIVAPHCHWCIGRQIGNSKCVHESQLKSGWCDGSHVNIRTHVKDFHPGTNVSQILPQYAKVALRVREEYKMNITYRRLQDYPVDLYYLMDLSASMRDDKANLATLGDKLAAAMKNVTSNFRLGFGSFVDKVTLPFVNTHPKKLMNPCQEGACVKPYSFKNHMPLTDRTEEFNTKVSSAPVSGNVDNPEGGFDALMQAIVCTEEIKWRRDARRLLVMATDASFHIAGDGKLGGVVEPNDEQCHMDKGEYTHGLVYDYPSISQIDRLANKHSITLIFAVVKGQEETYKSLIENIRDAAMGTLNENSSNVIQLVLDVYMKLTETVTVRLHDAAANKGIRVTYRAFCSDASHPTKSNSCDKIHARRNVTFEVSIKVPSCPVDAGEIWKETLVFSPNGINEETKIDLEVHCGCNCEKDGSEGFRRASPLCSGHGDQMCGVCRCQDAFTGQKCQCDKHQVMKSESDAACVSDNVTRTICSDRGSCVCNVCACMKRQNPEEKVYGPFCECDNFSCLRSDGKVCSGAERGVCDCGKCVCHPGWSGADCNCADHPRVCLAPGDDHPKCSGAGTCECGRCTCNKGHTGLFCEDCLDCVGGRCKKLGKCIEFLVHSTGHYDQDVCDAQNITIKEVVKEKIKEKDLQEKQHRCKHPDDAGCSFVFTYEVEGHKVYIIAEAEKECPEPVNLLGVIFGVVGGTVLIGLLSLIIWKVLTSYHDRREFAKFEKERDQSKWDGGENPLYKQATSTFSNPTFSGGN